MKFAFIDQDLGRDFTRAEDIVSPLREMGHVADYDDEPCSQDVLYERAKDADVIFFAINRLENPLIEKLKSLKLVQFMGVGYKNYVDVDFCAGREIEVRGVGEYGSNAVAEYAVALMFSLLRGITLGDSRMKNKIWDMNGLLGRELSSSTVGIVGTGAIGRLVAQKVSLLGARVVAHDITEDRELIEKFKVRYVALKELTEISDIVSLHLKYTEHTEKIISREILENIKPGALFVNTARAQIADCEALAEMLQTGRISAAAIDVHNEEPPLDWSLQVMKNVVSTPHIGYYTDVANTNLLRKSVESALKYLSSSAN